MENILAIFTFIFYMLVNIPICVGIANVILKGINNIFAFISTHLTFTFTLSILLVTAVVILLKIVKIILLFLRDKENTFLSKIKKISNNLSKKWKLPIIAFSAYLYFAFVMGASFSVSNIFNIVLPVKIFYDESDKIEGARKPNFSFPFWKTYNIRLWNDLSINKKTFPNFHNIITQDFYCEYTKPDINRKKVIACILKNLGNQPLIIKRIKNVDLRRGSTEMTRGHFISPDIKGKELILNNEKIIIDDLAAYLSFLNSISPIILYPLEEIILFNVRPDCYNELLTIDIEIEYADFSGETNWNDCNKNVHIYRQIDEVKFNEKSLRSSVARTKYQCRIQ